MNFAQRSAINQVNERHSSRKNRPSLRFPLFPIGITYSEISIGIGAVLGGGFSYSIREVAPPCGQWHKCGSHCEIQIGLTAIEGAESALPLAKAVRVLSRSKVHEKRVPLTTGQFD